MAGVLVLAFAPSALALTTLALTDRYPTQSLGNRGSDVRAVQGFLISRGFPVTLDGIFGTTMRDAVRTFQASKGLTANGIVADSTWARLVIAVAPGGRGQAVKVLQRQLDEKRRAGLAIDGVFGTTTKAAVIAFQKHTGLTQNGLVDGRTWRRLLGHYETPSFNTTSLCDYSVGNGPANWATGDTIGQLEAATASFARTGHGRVAVGDASLEHGGDIAGHKTHEVGLDVDVRLIRRDEAQCRWGTNRHYSSYDRTATRALIKAIRAAAPGHVKLIYFNDPVLIHEGLTKWSSGHDDHLHIRYCETRYPVAAYEC